MTSELVAEAVTNSPSTDARPTVTPKNTSFPVIDIAPLFTEDLPTRQACIEQIKILICPLRRVLERSALLVDLSALMSDLEEH